MDIPRTGEAQRRRLRRNIFIAAGIAVVSLVTIGLSRLEPAAPTVEKETVLIDTVKRGLMLRQVRGPGTLVPEDVRWISAPVEGRVERIPALPGVEVKADTVLLEMSDPQIEQNALEAEAQLKAAQADYDDLRAKLENELLSQQAQLATAESQSEQANLQQEADEKLAKDGLIPDLTLKLSRLRATQLSKQARIERERVQQNRRSAEAQLAAQRARVDQMRAMYELRRRQVDSLRVRAGISGQLQELPVQVGQSVTPGMVLARVARPEKLKAELRIPEVQAKDVRVGQRATIDTRPDPIQGIVMRVAPSSQDGSVIVDVSLEGPLPAGARPNLSVDGTIEIERLPDILYVSRPAIGQANSKIELFKLVKDGKEAVRVPVELGRTSVNTVEIVKGLQVGDQVILSDTSAQDGYQKIRLN
ncbi:MAG TPA: HlyD family efflux transporter periplasmic adaptor subunit [Thermoanaerobaculia bacterium]|jgi:HlyD family secretion protein|nr:HlyD family efflux transporter periplasmic adaptor subunit [Thermoanaerobaculia bacterium]